MSRESLVLVIGLLLIFVPVIGVPAEWKQYVIIGMGILLVILGYSLRRSSYLRRIDRGGGESGSDSFTENQPSLLDDSADKRNSEEV